MRTRNQKERSRRVQRWLCHSVMIGLLLIAVRAAADEPEPLFLDLRVDNGSLTIVRPPRLVTLNDPFAEPAGPHVTAIVHTPGAATTGTRQAKDARSRTTAAIFVTAARACRTVPEHDGTARETTTIARTTLP